MNFGKITTTIATMLQLSSTLAFSADKETDHQAEMEKGWHSEICESKSMKEAVKIWQADGFGVFIGFYGDTEFQGRWQGEELTKDLWGEWIMKRAGISIPDYEAKVKNWNPSEFNADKCAELFKEAGFKYSVYMAKHHDGFAHFKSQVDSYNMVDHSGFPYDPFTKLSSAMRKRGVKSGFYYSHGTDWHAPGGKKGPKGRTMEEYFDELVLPHLKELTSNYGPQHVVWFDLGAPQPLAEKCIEVLRKKQPHIMVSSRVGGKLGDFSTGGDCDVPPAPKSEPWETCMTLNDHWAWYPQDRDHKSLEEIIQMLATIRSRGGNLLLNIGIDVRGRIPLRETITLKKVGAWLKKNGEAIYGVKQTPYSGDLPWGVCTQKTGKLFLHIFDFPSLDTLFLPGLQNDIKKAYFLADSKKHALAVKKVDGGHMIDLTSIDISEDFLDQNDTVIAIEFTGELSVDRTPVLDHDLDNKFIPDLAKNSNMRLKKYRRTPYIGSSYRVSLDNGASKGRPGNSSLTWSFALKEPNAFSVFIEYANLTNKAMPVTLEIGEKILNLELPQTIAHSRDPHWFKKEDFGVVHLKPGKDQAIVLKIDQWVTDDEKLPVNIKDKKLSKKHDGLIIKSLILKSVYPLPY